MMLHHSMDTAMIVSPYACALLPISAKYGSQLENEFCCNKQC